MLCPPPAAGASSVARGGRSLIPTATIRLPCAQATECDLWQNDRRRTTADRRPANSQLRSAVYGESMLEVIEGGFLTTVQDTGRIGWGCFGVPPAGPMD